MCATGAKRREMYASSARLAFNLLLNGQEINEARTPHTQVSIAKATETRITSDA